MRKEILFAILAGSVVGLIVAFGVWKANKALREDSVNEQQQEKSTESSSKSIGNFELVIDRPVQQQVVTEDTVELVGLTSPNTYILISSNEDDFLTKSEGDGAFTRVLNLEPGLNEIFVVAYNENGESLSDKVLVVYSSQFDQESDTESTSEANIQTGTAMTYMGTVTDLTEDTVQLRDLEGEIKLVSIGENTSYVQLTDDQEDIDFEDVAIGDFVMALGYLNGQEVLEGQRVIVSEPFEFSELLSYQGTVRENDEELLLQTSDEDVIVNAGKGTTTLYEDNSEADEDFDEIESGQKIIITGENSNDGFEARSVFILD